MVVEVGKDAKANDQCQNQAAKRVSREQCFVRVGLHIECGMLMVWTGELSRAK